MSTENHIDIYDGSEVQPPSYLNVKDAPDHEVIDDNNISPGPFFVDGDLNASNNNNNNFLFNPGQKFEFQTRNIGEENVTSNNVTHNGYVNIESNPTTSRISPSQVVTSKRRNRDFGYSLSRSKSVCDISSMSQQRGNVDVDTESVTSSRVSETATLNRRTNYDGSSLASRGSKSSRVVRNRTILGSFPLFYKLSQSLSSLNTATTTGTTATSATQCPSFVGDNPLESKLDPR